MRRFEPITFDVEIHPEVWRQIAVVPVDTFRALQRGMAEQAFNLGQAAAAGEALGATVNLPIQGYEAVCEIDLEARLLRLVRIARTGR